MEDEHYPYELSSDEIGLSESMFRKTVYLVENQEKLLEKNETVRQIVYPMVKKLLEEGDARFIVDKVLSLPEEKKQQLHALLQTADFEEIIRFSSQVARKQQFIKFLEELTYGKLSKSIKERSQLHKIVQNELWIFNEAYNGTPQLWSDKSLANNLDELHRKYFEYEPTEIDENLIEDYKDTVRDITDLFFYNEKRLVNGRREVMIVELKSPSCAISNHEMNQAKRYAFDIHKYPKFDKSQVCYKIILISSHLTERAKSEINNFPNLGEIGLFDRKIENGEDIRVYAMTWSELIERNKRALSYLSESLTLKEKEATINEITSLKSEAAELNDEIDTLLEKKARLGKYKDTKAMEALEESAELFDEVQKLKKEKSALIEALEDIQKKIKILIMRFVTKKIGLENMYATRN
mgnify:CR=1 FL=1